jgi:chromosomal replication initiation ATPase DnaA
MADFFYRTEDIKPEEVAKYFVETKRDREIINALKARNPVVLAGSRGVGKSFLLRVAESELLADFESQRVLPVYVSFSRSSLINTTDPQQFQH